MSFNKEDILKAYGVSKSWFSRTSGKLLGRQKGRFTMRFYKDMGGWFADVPGWPGPKAALAMVWGADTFLAHLAKGNNEVTIEVSDQEEPHWGKLTWVHDHFHGDGAHYATTMNGGRHILWLCAVTQFVMGGMPKEIWFQKVA
jgi:hypothetical protein